MKDVKILLLALIPVVILVTFTLLAPIYMLPNGTYERHWVWDAPSLKVRHGYDDLSKEDIERLNADPHQRQILEGMKNMPRSYPIHPIYLGSRWGPGQNVLGYLAMMSIIAWCALFAHKWWNR